MVAYKETAEEQLLRMIEGPRGAPAPSSGQAAPAAARRPGMPLGPLKELWGDLKNRFRQALGSFKGKESAGDPLLWNLQLAGRFLWLFLAVLGVYVVLDLVVMQPAAVMLAWLLRHPAGIVPVIGASKPEHIIDNCAADRVNLSREEWTTLFNAAAALDSFAFFTCFCNFVFA